MAFVTCSQYKKSQEEQDKEIKDLDKKIDDAKKEAADCCESNKLHVDQNGGIAGDGHTNSPISLDINHDNTLVGKGTTDDKLGVNLSPDPGNLIQKRGNGLYYGEVAPPDISKLYVSNLIGNDSNIGSRDWPFKTVQKALDTISNSKSPGRYTIFLRAQPGESYSTSAHEYLGYGDFSIIFTFYDDPKYVDAFDRGTYYVSCADDLTRPPLNFATYMAPYGGIVGSGISGGGVDASTIRLKDIEFIGLTVNFADNAGPTSTGEFFFYADHMAFKGCDTNVYSSVTGIGSATSIQITATNFNLAGGAKPFTSEYGPTLFGIDIFTPGTEMNDPVSEAPIANYRSSNYKQVLNPQNTMALSQSDSNTKTLFGWNTNWDIFIGS